MPLSQAYDNLGGKVEIGVRPEAITLTEGKGLPVKIRRGRGCGAPQDYPCGAVWKRDKHTGS